ncbi:MAG: hypothetical protein ABSF87_12785 [Xanthobacteraceae bacterium]|jgi:hypothetical protein
MAGKLRPIKAIHEAAHAVIARKLGIEAHFVSMRSTAHGNLGAVDTDSAYWLAKGLDIPGQIVAYENGAKVAPAGLSAQARLYPDSVSAGIVETEGDIATAQSIARTIVWIRAGNVLPDDDQTEVLLSTAMLHDAQDVYERLINETHALVDTNWPAIGRVANHLESHDRIDQTELDRLIAVAERH